MYAYSKKHNYIIKWNAKCGCTLFRQLFLDLHKDELENEPTNRWHDISKDFPIPRNISKIQKIILCRNPYYRVVSMFCNKYCGGEGHNLLSKKFKLEKCTFRCFINKLLEFKKNNRLNKIDLHIMEQTYDFEFDKYTHILHIEKFNIYVIKTYNKLKLKNLVPSIKLFIKNQDKYFKNISNRNDETEYVFDKEYSVDDTIFPDYKYFYDENLLKMVYEIYKNDFKIFNYNYNLIPNVLKY